MAEAFEGMSKLADRVSKAQFLDWIKEGLVLNGFHLSVDMEQELFATFDKHRKGYLMETDIAQTLRPFLSEL